MPVIRAGSCPSLLAGRGGRDRSAKAALAEHAHDVPLVLRAAAVVGLRLRGRGGERGRLADRVVGRLGCRASASSAALARRFVAPTPVSAIPTWPIVPVRRASPGPRRRPSRSRRSCARASGRSRPCAAPGSGTRTSVITSFGSSVRHERAERRAPRPGSSARRSARAATTLAAGGEHRRRPSRPAGRRARASRRSSRGSGRAGRRRAARCCRAGRSACEERRPLRLRMPDERADPELTVPPRSPSSPGTPLMSTTVPTEAKRSFSTGIRLCPPAITLASPACSPSAAITSSTDVGAR